MSETNRCWWCGGPADRLCDTLLLADQAEISGDLVTRKVTARRVLGFDTCDAEVCSACSESSTVHFAIDCGMFDDEGEPLGRTETDSRDACPFCVANPGLHARIDAGKYRERTRSHAAQALAKHEAKLILLKPNHHLEIAVDKPRRFSIPDDQRRILEHFVCDRGWRRFAGLHETLAAMRDAGRLRGRWAKDEPGTPRRFHRTAIEWALRGRNMSFMLTPTQVVDRTKDVTRRLGWPHLRSGELLYACEKCQGLKPGEQIKGLAILGVLDVRRERLDAIDQADVVREGFPDLDPAGFVAMFCSVMKCKPETLVTRIEFERLA